MQLGNWRYDIVEAGYKCNMTDIFASMGMVELERYDDDTLKKRKWICKKYMAALSKYLWAILPVQKQEIRNRNEESSYHLYPLRIKGITEAQRDEIIKKIFEKEVSVNVHFIPVTMMSIYKSIEYVICRYLTIFVIL